MNKFVTSEQLDKYNKLLSILAYYGKVAVAFSSGVDSTFLLYAARCALSEKVIAITARSPVFPKRETTEAEDYCKKIGIAQEIIDINELEIEGFSQNPTDRCYICKKSLFKSFKEKAAAKGFEIVVEGSNKDDEGDYRPGLKAVTELGIKSPLRDAGLYKEEIRILSEHFGLPTWDKPSFACLASRFPYGEMINDRKLKMVDSAEQLLMQMGFKQFRVRIHGNDIYTARIELLTEDMPEIFKEPVRKKVYEEFKRYGFNYVSIDLKGYRTGSMNETL